MQNTNALINTLQNGVAFVTFRKQDGTVREMTCTLQATRINYENKTTGERKRNDNVLVVWDISKAQWRSMRNDSIICWADVTSSYAQA
jgi:hypothetical protein